MLAGPVGADALHLVLAGPVGPRSLSVAKSRTMACPMGRRGEAIATCFYGSRG